MDGTTQELRQRWQERTDAAFELMFAGKSREDPPHRVEEARYRAHAKATRRARRRLLESRRRSNP